MQSIYFNFDDLKTIFDLVNKQQENFTTLFNNLEQTTFFARYADYVLLIGLLTTLFFIATTVARKKFVMEQYLTIFISFLILYNIKELQIYDYTNINHYIMIKTVQFLSFLVLIYVEIIYKHQKQEKIIWEYPTLMLFAILGMLISMETTEAITIFLTLEMQAFTFYTIVSLKKENIFSAEAGLKYFLIGAIASSAIIFGIGFVYGYTGNTNLPEIADLLPIAKTIILFTLGGALIIIGLLFKIGAVPFHLWLPDAYQGAPFYVLIFIAILPKIILLFLLFTFNNIMQQDLIIFIACVLSAIIGSIQAVSQTKMKRFLAFTIIFNNTFFLALMILSGKGAYLALMESIALYLLVSFLILLTVFCLINVQTSIRFLSLRDFISLKKSNIYLAFIIMLSFFSAAGIPPFIGFFQKYIALFALVEKSQVFLMVFLIAASILPAFYYLRITKILFFLTESRHILLMNITWTGAIILSTLFILTLMMFFL